MQHQKTMASSIAHSENLKCLQWAYDKGYIFDVNVFKSVFFTGNVKIMEWLMEIGCPYNKLCYSSSDLNIVAGSFKKIFASLDMLKLLYHNGCVLTNFISFGAAYAGNLEMLKFIHENALLLSPDIIYYAAQNGHLHIIHYALQHNCTYGADAINIARENYHYDVVKYLCDYKKIDIINS